jgi:hypothetical protein
LREETVTSSERGFPFRQRNFGGPDKSRWRGERKRELREGTVTSSERGFPFHNKADPAIFSAADLLINEAADATLCSCVNMNIQGVKGKKKKAKTKTRLQNDN